MAKTPTLQPTVKLSATDKRLLASLQAKRAAGSADITIAEQRAYDRWSTEQAQRGFVATAAACPRALVEQLAGVPAARLRKIATACGCKLSGAEIDLVAALPRVFAALEEWIENRDNAAGEGIARTYGELVKRLALSGADPVRQLKDWHARGMPGKPATPGRRNGRFVVADCREWIAAHVDRQDAPAGDGEDVRALRRRLLELDLQIKEAERLEQLGRLADVDQIADFNTQCVNNARAILEAWPDKAIGRLPAELPEAVRAAAFADAGQLVDDTLDELARIIEGDTDPTDDDLEE